MAGSLRLGAAEEPVPWSAGKRRVQQLGQIIDKECGDIVDPEVGGWGHRDDLSG